MSLMILTEYIDFTLDTIDESHPILRSELNISLSDKKPSKTQFGLKYYPVGIVYKHDEIKVPKQNNHYKTSKKFLHQIIIHRMSKNVAIIDPETGFAVHSDFLYTFLTSTNNELRVDNFKDIMPDVEISVCQDYIMITAPKDKYSVDYEVNDQLIDEDGLYLKYFSTYHGSNSTLTVGSVTTVHNAEPGLDKHDTGIYLPKLCRLLNLKEFMSKYSLTELAPRTGERVYKYVGEPSPLNFLLMSIDIPNPAPDQVISLYDFIRHTNSPMEQIVLSLSNCKIYVRLIRSHLTINLMVHTKTPI